ncbi:MAG: carboxypeptidase-like regulatory domain-containing protein [Nitrososphaeria archaeon]
MKEAPVLLFVVLFLLSFGFTARAQTETASIRVVDQAGNPQVATTVILSTATVRKSFFTNGTGWAEFVGLSPETYNVSVLYSDVVIATDTMTIPEEKVKTVSVFLKDLSVRLLDLGGDPVSDREVVLASERGGFTQTRETGKDGTAVFQSLPYSSIETIGPYNLNVEYDGIKVVQASVSVPVSEVTLTARLLDLNVTVTDLRGNSVKDASVLIRSTKSTVVSQMKSTSAGSALFEELPASGLPEVGEYEVSATVRQVVVFNQTRGFDESLNLSAVASLGELSLKVVDESGDPVPEVLISVSNEANPSYGAYDTDSEGQAVLREMPLSTTKAGQYNLVFKRGGVKVKEFNFSLSLSQPFAEETVTIDRIEVHISVKDFRGNPVENAAIELTDLSLPDGKIVASTSRGGLADVEALPGAYTVTVQYRGHEVMSRIVAVNQTTLEIAGVAVDLPVTIVVVDSSGSPLSGVVARAIFGGESLFEGEVGRNGSFDVTVPHGGPLTVSVEVGGVLQAVETILVDRPTTQYVTLRSIVGFAGFHVSVGTLMAAVTVLVIVVFVGLNVAVRRKMLTKRLKGIRRAPETSSGEGKSKKTS